MLNRKILLLITNFVFILFSTINVKADEDQSEAKTYVDFSTTVIQDVKNDLLTASLLLVKESSSAKEVQQKINKGMEKALGLVKTFSNIEVATERYEVYQYNSDVKAGRKEILYKASQIISLKGTDATAILQLAGELQNMGLLMQNLSYTLSNKKFEEMQNELVAKAIKNTQDKANFIVKTLGKSSSQLLQLNIVSNDNYLPSSRPFLAMKSSASSSVDSVIPVAEPGKSQISLTINSKIKIE